MEIQGYSNYLIYDDGRVYSKKNKIFLKPGVNGRGYKYCSLWKKGEKPKSLRIHRLVAEHYIPNPENKEQVDHINRNKQDNRIENLRWVTQSENQQNTGIRCDSTTGIKNIRPHTQGGYMYEKRINKKNHCKYFKTLEEAIQYKEEYEKSLQVQ
jgi:hypothetical protein